MTVPASEILSFLASQDRGTVIRHEIDHPALRSLLFSARQIIVALGEMQDPESDDISNQLRALISEWLTIPLAFDSSMFEALKGLLGTPASAQIRWGADVRTQYETALRATESLAIVANPLREKVREVIEQLRGDSLPFKIYCHRRARPYFDSLFISSNETPIPEESYLHSVRDYRNARPFSDLIKVGPLRARGWSSAPDALITAPRFRNLQQVVWSGCRDESDFGYNPVHSSGASHDPSETSAPSGRDQPGAVKWTTIIRGVGESPRIDSNPGPTPAEVWVFKEARQAQDRRMATLVQVDDEHGMLFPRHSRILSFNPNQDGVDAIAHRVLGETLGEGMFVVIPITGDIDLGGVHAEHGACSQVWKKRLDDQWRANGEGLVSQLERAGLALVHLKSAIRNWRKSPGTVIHAPQRLSHFKVLMRVLGLDRDTEGAAQVQTSLPFVPFWQRAWHEIRQSRGEAIQAGVLGHEIVDDQLFGILRDLLSDIRGESARSQGFRLKIPSRYGIDGYFAFFKISAIEEGFRAPETELKSVRDLRMIDQWRD